MTITHRPRLSALTVALLVAAAALLVPSPASADTASFTLTGTLHLTTGIGLPGDAPGCFGGTANGVHGTYTATATKAYAGLTHNDAGDAEGNLEIHMDNGSSVEVSFVWDAGGVITFTGDKSGHTGIGIVAFVPVDVDAFACHPTRTDKNYAHDHDSTHDSHAQMDATVVFD